MPQQSSINPGEIGEISEQHFKIGYWFTTHRESLKKALIIFLIGLSVIFYGYSIYKVIDLYILQANNYQKMMNLLPYDLVNYKAFKAKDQPSNLQILGISILSTDKQKYDLLAKVRNPNPKWYAEIEYQFFASGIKTKTYKNFLLPSEEKFLIDLAITSETGIVQPRLEFKSVTWKKVLQFTSLKQEKINFLVENIKFIPAKVAELGEKIAVSQTTFDVANMSAYNYWQVGFYIVLYSGTRAVAINYISLDQFTSGQKRPVVVNWFEKLPGVTKVEVRPEINILDPNVFMEFTGEPGEAN